MSTTNLRDVCESGLQDLDRRRTLLEKLDELEPEDREVLGLHYFDGLSHERMGEILECSPEKARKRCRQALERLARRMEA